MMSLLSLKMLTSYGGKITLILKMLTSLPPPYGGIIYLYASVRNNIFPGYAWVEPDENISYITLVLNTKRHGNWPWWRYIDICPGLGNITQYHT
jgi:hypothetical protein